ncbi:MAG: hypothetical protein JRL30_18225 [Deltaproteobacteria bacterium]|nr:hypothetical protein [Deltaproteobacteria bacterium]
MDWSFLNEYTLLYVFCAGVVTQSLLALRSLKQELWAGIMMIICLVPAWYLPGPGDRAFATPLCWALFYSILFSIVFRKRMLPVVTGLVLLLYTGLLYYVLYLSAVFSGVKLPKDVMIAGIVPGILVVVVSLSGMLKYKVVRALCYTWYLIALCLMIGCQWSLEGLASLYAEGGFSLNLFVYVFLGGGVLLIFVSNLVQLFLLLPAPTRPSHRIVLDAVTGPVAYHREQGTMMAGSFLGREIDKRGWVLVFGCLIFLWVNARFNFIPHGIVINLLILGIVWFVMPREMARFNEKPEEETQPHA